MKLCNNCKENLQIKKADDKLKQRKIDHVTKLSGKVTIQNIVIKVSARVVL